MCCKEPDIVISTFDCNKDSMEFMLTEGQKMLIKGSMENGLIVGRSFHLSDNSFLKEENPED